MGQAIITLPDGRRAQVTFESQEQLDAVINSFMAQQRPRGKVDLGPEASPVEGQSFGQNFLAGAGGRALALGRGARQAATEAFEMLTPFNTLIARGSGQPLRSDVLRQQEEEIRQRDEPLMNTRGGMVGSLATDIGLGYLGGKLLSGARMGMTPEGRAAVFGGVTGATQPLGQNENRGATAAQGAALSQGGQWLGDTLSQRIAARVGPAPASAADDLSASLGRTQAAADANNAWTRGAPLMTPEPATTPAWAGTPDESVAAGITNAQRDALRRGQALGMRATPGQATGNRPLQQVEAKLESQPMTSGPFFNIKEQNQRVVTREYLRAIGENGDEASKPVLQSARKRIGKAFDTILDRNGIYVSDDLRKSLTDLRTKADLELRSGQLDVLDKQIAEITSRADRSTGAIPGRAYQPIRESLNRLVAGKDGSLAYWARQLRDQLDEALERSSRPQDGPALREARRQWQLLEIGLGRQGAVNTDSGVVNPRAMAAAIEQGDRFGFKLGNRQLGLYDALGFARAFSSVVGDSGTATRSPLGTVDTLTALPANLAAAMYVSRPAVNLATGTQDVVGATARRVGPLATRFGAQAAPYLPPGLIGIPPFLAPPVGLLGRNPEEQ